MVGLEQAVLRRRLVSIQLDGIVPNGLSPSGPNRLDQALAWDLM